MKDYDVEIKDLEAKLAELKRKKEEAELIDNLGFEENEEVYRIEPDGVIRRYAIITMELWEGEITQGNLFHTLEEAEFEVERRKVVATLRYLSELSGEKENLWDGENEHWYIYYNYSTGKISLYGVYNSKYNCVHFRTKEAALNAIELVGEERVKKYYLGVK